MLLSETRRPQVTDSTYHHTLFRDWTASPRRLTSSGGITMLIHKQIAHRLLPTLVTTNIESCAVPLSAYGVEVHLVSTYLPTGREAPPPQDWNALLDSPLPTLVAGDLTPSTMIETVSVKHLPTISPWKRRSSYRYHHCHPRFPEPFPPPGTHTDIPFALQIAAV